MSTNLKCFHRAALICTYVFFSSILYSDNFNYNSYNNHGVIGLINNPTARFYDEGNFGITLFGGDPDQMELKLNAHL